MDCPQCHGATKILSTRARVGELVIVRRHECTSCGERFTTEERIVDSATSNFAAEERVLQQAHEMRMAGKSISEIAEALGMTYPQTTNLFKKIRQRGGPVSSAAVSRKSS